MIELHPITGMGEIFPGDALSAILLDAIATAGLELQDQDVLVVTHKVVSKAEGALAAAEDDDAYRALVESQAVAILRRRDDLVIAETSHGFVCANAGVDRSNVPLGQAVLLPKDPDGSAHALRSQIGHATGKTIAVVVTDTFGRAWRKGLSDVAIGVSGMPAILDLRGTTDTQGRELHATEIAIADEVAAAADLAMGKATGVPAVIVRGYAYDGEGRAAELVRDPDEDLFR